MVLTRTIADRLRGTAIVPAGLSAALIFFSMVFGWNLGSLLAFWFFVAPFLALYLPVTVSGSENRGFKSSVGLVIFYSFMVFMIYDHYQSDYFRVMMFSFVVNFLVVLLISSWLRARVQTR